MSEEGACASDAPASAAAGLPMRAPSPHGSTSLREPLVPPGGGAPLPLWQERVLTWGGIAAVLGLPLALLVTVPRNIATHTLPFYLSLGCMLMVGWLAGRAADFLFGLPPLLGYMAFGYCFHHVEGPAMLAARPYILALSFLLVLVRAGLEVRPRDLTAFTLALGTLPYAADVAGSSVTCHYLYGLTPLEAVAFGAIMSALGDGIVIPRMADLCARTDAAYSPLPRAVLTAAPIECTVSLFTYGTLAELLVGRPAPGETLSAEETQPVALQAFLVVLRLVGTLFVAGVLAHVVALLLGTRRRLRWASGKRLFAGTSHEELVIVLAGAMLAYGMAALVPMPERFERPHHGPKRMQQAEGLVEADLAVVATIFFFARLRPPHAVRRIEESVAAVWTVAALCLFVSLGSALDLPALAPGHGIASVPAALLLPLAAGLGCRFVCYLLLLYATAPQRRVPRTACNALLEATFCACATMPRATIQGVLGSLPLRGHVVSAEVGELIHAAAAMTVLLFAPLGVIVQELGCERALLASAPPRPAFERRKKGVVLSVLEAALSPHWLTVRDAMPGASADAVEAADTLAELGGAADGAGRPRANSDGDAGYAGAAPAPPPSSAAGGMMAGGVPATPNPADLDLARIAMLHSDGPLLDADPTRRGRRTLGGAALRALWGGEAQPPGGGGTRRSLSGSFGGRASSDHRPAGRKRSISIAH